MEHLKDDLELMEELMDNVTETTIWGKILKSDPSIQAAEAELTAKIDGLQRAATMEQMEDIKFSALSFGNAMAYAAILYGIHVAQAVQRITATPETIAALSQHVLDRIAGMRGCGDD